MFLTRLYLNKERRGARRLLGSPQALHAAVLAGFPPIADDDRPTSRVLWRLDTPSSTPTLYVVSPARPDLTHLVEQAGWPSVSTWETRDYQPLLAGLATGQCWGFRLTANTTKSMKLNEDARRSKRYGHVTAEQQQLWLIQRLPQLGVQLAKTAAGDDELQVDDRSIRKFVRQRSTVTLSVATFRGLLVVDDPAPLRAALIGGIGPAKAYGCGLLTLARV